MEIRTDARRTILRSGSAGKPDRIVVRAASDKCHSTVNTARFKRRILSDVAVEVCAQDDDLERWLKSVFLTRLCQTHLDLNSLHIAVSTRSVSHYERSGKPLG
jgi:hypothetical protein